MYQLRKKITIRLVGLFLGIGIQFWAQAQENIFDVMQRTDLSLQQVQSFAKKWFDSLGTAKGTGYNQYQRWLYEVKFHVDEKGYRRSEDFDQKAYKTASIQTLGVENNLLPWTEKGPFAWNRTSGWNPGVGRITAIGVAPSDTNTIYITSPGGGLWKTSNGGANWIPLTDYSNSLLNLYAVCVHPADPQTVYAGSAGGTVIKSTNGGISFTTVSSGGIGGVIRKISIHPSNSNIVFVCCSNGIFKSTNGGGTWVAALNVNIEDLECKPNDPNIMYATGANVYRSTNEGLTWVQMGAAAGITTSGRTLVSVSAADPERVYLVQSKGREFGYMYRSNDAGLSFSITVTGNPATCTNFFGYPASGCETGGQASYDMAMCANPDNANELHIGGIICWRSLDGGLSFQPETEWFLPNSTGYNHANVHVLNWVRKTIYSGSDGGIYKSINSGDDWIDLSKGLGIRQFYRIAVSKTNLSVITGGSQDNGSSISKKSGWIDWLGADGMDCLFSPLDSNLLWGTSQNGAIYRSTNGGGSRTSLSQPSNGNWVTPLAIEGNTNTIYGGWTGVYKSTNLGSSWTKISDVVITAPLDVLAVSGVNADFIYASRGSTLYVTSNGGSTWNTYTYPSTITTIATSPYLPNKIYIGANTTGAARLSVSTNAGASFTNIADGLPETAVRSIALDYTLEEGIYAGMNVGVFYKDNNSAWSDISSNLPKVAVNEVEVSTSGRILRLATYGRGVWERNVAGGLCPGGNFNLPANFATASASFQWQADLGTGFANITDVPLFSGTATSELTIKNVATTMYNHKFRCLHANGSFSQEYTLKFTAIWTGNVSNDWDNTANWSCGSIPNENTDVIVGAEKTVYPLLKQNTTVRSIHLANGAKLNVQSGFKLQITGKL
jgi:photosystem II stability/assembly factor-like uncharacterized protein